MGIYIKGMEMPKEGSAFAIAIHPDGTITSWTGREMPQYDAVPVQPHGRLIDADALEEEVRQIYSLELISYNGMLDVIAALNCNAPTIIPAEEGER